MFDCKLDVCTYLFELIYTPCFTCYIHSMHKCILFTLMFITRRNNILHAFFLQSLIILYDKSNNVLYMWFIILGAAICTPFSLHAWSYYYV